MVASAVRCGGCTPLCTHCAEGAVTPFLCGHCLSVPGTEGADHVNCTKSFRLLGKKCPGYFMCVSNAIPHNTPVENALYYNEAYEQTCLRH